MSFIVTGSLRFATGIFLLLVAPSFSSVACDAFLPTFRPLLKPMVSIFSSIYFSVPKKALTPSKLMQQVTHVDTD